MKLLLDENLPHRLRELIPGHLVFTAAFMGYQGLANGALLTQAAADGFDVMLSLDSGLEYQRNLETLPCALIVIQAPSNRLTDLLPLLPRIIECLATIRPREFSVVT